MAPVGGHAMAKVEVYTNKGCGACVRAKQHLDSKNVDFIEHRLGSSRRIDAEFSMRTKGARSIPQIFIDDEWIGGFDDLIRFDTNGELNWRLGLEPKPKIKFFTRILRYLKGQNY
jgi:glutaredoxin 3